MRKGALLLLFLVCSQSCRQDKPPDPQRTEDPQARPGGVAPTPSGNTSLSDALGPVGAVAVVQRYYEAIQRRDFQQAYRLWEGEGEASSQTFEDFAAGFAETASVDIEIGSPGRIEGAAGSRYIEIPVHLEATTKDGQAQSFRGKYVLRRSVIDGASAEQRAWRIYSADLRKLK
jgi:hypothetical protein